MPRRRRLAIWMAVLAGAVVFARPAAAEIVFSPCVDKPGVECATLPVPLDRASSTPETVALHVERLPSGGERLRRVMLLVAGGPGQASAQVFNLGSPFTAGSLQAQFPNHTIVAFDPRGTGRSGLLRCPALEGSFAGRLVHEHVAECAATIGPRRRFFTTRDHADDIEAVRAALGVDRIGIWGTSYGTKLAQAYAVLYPTRVERLLLDSALPLEGPELLGGHRLRALPAGLAALCAGGVCSRATPSFAADVVALANRLAVRPLRGTVFNGAGRRIREEMDGVDLLEVVISADIDPGLAAHLPAAVRAARQGRPRPLLRLLAMLKATAVLDPSELSVGLFAATSCGDGPFPWLSSETLEQRRRTLNAAAAALPPGSTGPFGVWATRTGRAEFCLTWPEWTANLPVGAPYPDVPVLILAGDFDLRTPPAGAAEVAARFPQARLVVVPGVGHSVLGQDQTGCADEAVRIWLAGGVPPERCPRNPPLVTPLGPVPTSLAALPPDSGTRGLAGRTRRAVRVTLEEIGATFVLAIVESEGKRPVAVGGLHGGRLAVGDPRSPLRLTRYAYVPGVSVTGALTPASVFPPRLRGTIRVCGAGARGVLRVDGRRLSGTLTPRPRAMRACA